MRTEDGHIVQECLNGEPGAFGMLIDKYREGIYAFAYDKLRNFQDAQDVTQEVFLQAYKSLRTLRNWESLAFWLYRIAYARCVDLLRIRSRRVEQDSIEDQAPEIMDAPSMESYKRDQLDQSLREVLGSLPDAYREVLVLHYFGGMKIKDMAMALGASPSAIGKRLSRARSLLKEEMIDMMGEAFEEQRLPMGFTFRIVEAVKRIKIQPMPRSTALPWGLSLATGVIITILNLNPYMSITSDIAIPGGSPLPLETKVLRTGEIPVDILRIDKMSVISDKQGDAGGKELENEFLPGPDQGGTWARKADMLTARDIFSVCVVDGEIYAIGGNDDNLDPLLPTVEKYNPNTNTWTKLSNMPEVRCMHSTNSIDGKIYVIGGTDIIYGKLGFLPVLVYDPAKDIWTKKGKVPVEIGTQCSVVVNGKIYVIGGCDVHARAVSRVFEYDPRTDIWTRKADMPTARHTHVAGVVNGKIYVIGGGAPEYPWPDGECYPLSSVEEYDPATDTWAKKADMPTPRYYLSGCVLNGKIYVLGGSPREESCISTVEEYDPEMDMWKRMADMPNPRALLSSIAVNGRIYAIGGRMINSNVEIVSSVEEYTPEDWQVANNP